MDTHSSVVPKFSRSNRVLPDAPNQKKEMTNIEQIKRLLTLCSPAQQQEIFQYLRQEFPIHPLEAGLNTEAEVILEAIRRSGGLTLRMMRGVIAEAAFDLDVVKRLEGGAMSHLKEIRHTIFSLTMGKE
ncbi:hypothetical protein NKDENANG_01243 [Candidatus Entotheonellaceae bacterium PAL068K]